MTSNFVPLSAFEESTWKVLWQQREAIFDVLWSEDVDLLISTEAVRAFLIDPQKDEIGAYSLRNP